MPAAGPPEAGRISALRRRAAIRLLAVVLPLGSATAAAEAPAVRAEFLRTVLEAPALTAAARRAAAAHERIESAGRLPDPQVEGMASRLNGAMGERSTMFEINVRQPLPKRGERAADRARAGAGAAMADADHALMAGELAADTAMALAEAEGAQERIRILDTQLGRLDAVLRSVEVRLAAGTNARLADRLTVQTRLASMRLMIEEERRMAADLLAAARGRLGLAPDAPLPAFAAPQVGEIELNQAAALRFARARSEEASAMAKMARASAQPMTAIGVRLERERSRMGDANTVGLAFMSEIPWRSRGYARTDVRAAEAEHAAAQSDATSARYRIAATLTRVGRAEQLAATARRLSAETLERLQAEYDSLVRAAGVGGAGESTVLQTVELLERATDTELQIIRADTAVRTARAELWRFAPAQHFAPPNH